MNWKPPLFILSAIFLFNCNSNIDNKAINEVASGADSTINDNELADKDKNHNGTLTGTDMTNSISNFELLQGKWQSTEDKTNFIIFEGNLRKEIAGGMDKWDVETFILSDRCMNKSDIDKNVEAEKDKYISCEDSDLCWYILGVSKESLTLSYMGRGNTLMYKRAK
jgi:hypothetical protein